nr:red chlorophyll catabolite reductase, chloroplastic [Tanacetum cinerariifolium]
MIDFILGSWLHCGLPTGGALNITSLSAYLNSSTDAPNLLVELIQSSPTSMVLILDLPPRMDLVLNPDYLKTFYEDTQLDQHRQYLEKLPEIKPYFSSSLYIRTVVSPTAILVRIETEQIEEMIETHVTPIAKEVLKTWLDICAFGKRTVGDSERDYLKKRDHMTKSKTIEIDLGSSLPRKPPLDRCITGVNYWSDLSNSRATTTFEVIKVAEITELGVDQGDCK